MAPSDFLFAGVAPAAVLDFLGVVLFGFGAGFFGFGVVAFLAAVLLVFG